MKLPINTKPIPSFNINDTKKNIQIYLQPSLKSRKIVLRMFAVINDKLYEKRPVLCSA